MNRQSMPKGQFHSKRKVIKLVLNVVKEGGDCGVHIIYSRNCIQGYHKTFPGRLSMQTRSKPRTYFELSFGSGTAFLSAIFIFLACLLLMTGNDVWSPPPPSSTPPSCFRLPFSFLPLGCC